MVTTPRREDLAAISQGNLRLLRAFEGLFEAAGDQGYNLDDLATLIDTNTANITTNAGDIAGNTADIASNTLGLASLSTTVGTHTTDLADHETRIGDLETQMAAIAAIVALTDSTGGSAGTTLSAVSGSGDDSTINDNLASIAAKINAVFSAAS